MKSTILLLPLLIPSIAAIMALVVPKKMFRTQAAFGIIASLIQLVLAAILFGKEITFSMPWAGFGFEFILRLYHFSAFIMLAAAGFALAVSVYAAAFMRGRDHTGQFFAYLLFSLVLVTGAALADNLVLMLFFWEGLLVTLFGMIAIGGKGAFKSATKAFIILGVSDLCMMAGIAFAGSLAGTLTMSKMSIPLGGIGSLAFILLMIGAISKAGSMPFHSWIPDAAIDAPLPFMAILPASLEKLLGIYFLGRITLDLFRFDAHSKLSLLLMIIGAATILFAVMMALVQKDYKRLLSYHAISQVGYMILGIGSFVPAGIVGGLFHMINNAMYKSCLFLTGGSVEKQTGTTNLGKLGGIGKKMPITFACFIVAAAAISGVPPFNGFFSKELIYEGVLERGVIFYIVAALGSFLTAASFLKLGHATFLGKAEGDLKKVREAPLGMLIPMVAIASLCVLFGLWNALPLRAIIQPILGEGRLEGHDFSGLPTNAVVVGITIAVLIGAVLHHLYGVKKGKGASHAADHIHNAPVLSTIYAQAEKGNLDPYTIGTSAVGIFSRIAWTLDKINDWIVDVLVVKCVSACTNMLRKRHDGSYVTYIIWSLVAAVLAVMTLMRS